MSGRGFRADLEALHRELDRDTLAKITGAGDRTLRSWFSGAKPSGTARAIVGLLAVVGRFLDLRQLADGLAILSPSIETRLIWKGREMERREHRCPPGGGINPPVESLKEATPQAPPPAPKKEKAVYVAPEPPREAIVERPEALPEVAPVHQRRDAAGRVCVRVGAVEELVSPAKAARLIRGGACQEPASGWSADELRSIVEADERVQGAVARRLEQDGLLAAGLPGPMTPPAETWPVRSRFIGR